MNNVSSTQELQRVSIIAFLAITCVIIAGYALITNNLRLQNNMLEASSISYELRILLDEGNEQASLLFDPNSSENFSDRILVKIRDDFVDTTKQVSVMTEKFQALFQKQRNSFGSFISTESYQKIVTEIQHIDDIWNNYRDRISQLSNYSISTLRSGNKLWLPIDASIGHNGALAKSISELNQLVYQSSLQQNKRLNIFYTTILFLTLLTVWCVWSFTLRPLTKRLKASYQEIICNNERLGYQANHDALTGLLNRAAFNKKIDELEKNEDQTKPCCLVLIDLDNFKMINDTQGHNVGDLVLQKITDDILINPLADEHAYRLGGDEFALLIDCQTNELALKLRIEALLNKVRTPFEFERTVIQCSCSIGIAIAGNGCGYEQTELFTAADTALYHVKALGRNGYQLYNEMKPIDASEMAQRDGTLQDAVKYNDFHVYYQPIIDINSQQTQGFEARAHWNHPNQGELNHDEWINDATRLSLDSEITRQVIHSITADFRKWLKQGFKLRPVTVDIGQSLLLSGDAYTLITNLAKELPYHGLIGIEVSEMIFNERSFDSVIEQLKRFKKAGIPITIDHYGRGHSSLLQLRKIPFDVIKIDKKLTLQASQDQSLQTYIRSLVSFTQGVGKKLICQSKQGDTEVHKLTKLGCRYCQSQQASGVLSSDELAQHFNKTPKLASV